MRLTKMSTADKTDGSFGGAAESVPAKHYSLTYIIDYL